MMNKIVLALFLGAVSLTVAPKVEAREVVRMELRGVIGGYAYWVYTYDDGTREIVRFRTQAA